MQRQLTDSEIETLKQESRLVYEEEKIPESLHHIINEINIHTLNLLLEQTIQLKEAPSLTLVMDILEKNQLRNTQMNEELKLVFTEEQISRINKSGAKFKETDLLKQIFNDFEKALKEAPEHMIDCDWNKAFELASARNARNQDRLIADFDKLKMEDELTSEELVDFKQMSDKLDELNERISRKHLALFDSESKDTTNSASPPSPESPGYRRY